MAEQHRRGAGWWVLPLAVTEPLSAYWGASGMKMTFTAFACVLLPYPLTELVERGRTGLWLFTAALAVTLRPEGVIVVGCALACLLGWAAAARVAGRATPWRALGWAVGAPGAIAATMFTLRRLVYGLWWPQPVLSKTFTERGAAHGWRYLDKHEHLVEWTVWFAVAASAAGLFVAWKRRESPLYGLLAGGTLFALGSFAVLSGGDWMGVGRFLVPVAPVALAVVAHGLRALPWPALGLLALIGGGRHLWLADGIATDTGTGRPLADARATRDALPEGLRGYPLVEYANIAHLRDVHLIDAIERALPQVRARVGGRPIVLFSGQAGMVPYYLFSRHDDLFFVDGNSLSTRDVEPCIPAKAFHKWPTGKHFDLRTLLRHRSRIRQRCGVEAPDIVFESGPNAARALRGLDYTLVLDLPSVRRGQEDIAGGRSRLAGGWVAVRSALLASPPTDEDREPAEAR